MKHLIFILCALLFVIAACDKSTKPLESVATPTISPNGGTYYSTQSIHIACPTTDATIRYTLDGTDPVVSSPIYSSPIGISSNTTVKAQAFKTKMKASAIASVDYSFDVGSMYFSIPGGTFTSAQLVSIVPSSAGTIVHYTIDGTEPTEASQIYTYPITIDRNTTLKAKGYVAGWNPCPTLSATYSFVATQPTFGIADGLYYNSFELSIATPTSGASIRYTTDGTAPTENSTLYTEPITISATTVIKAQAYKSGWTSSTVGTANYELKIVATVFNPIPGTFSTPQSVTITTTTPGTTIHYTTDGSDPTVNSSSYSAPVLISVNSTLKAVAMKSGWTSSNITSGLYSYDVSQPTFNPVAGSYSVPQDVVISCSTQSAEIRYTTDGSTPTVKSTLYVAPVAVSVSTTLKAKAYRIGWNGSPIATASYSINPTQTVATPTINPIGANYNSIQSVVLSCTTFGASIRYTSDNSEPTSASTLYSKPVTAAATTTLKAKAFKLGWFDSQTASETYTINFNSVQMVSIPGGTFTMGRTTGSGEADEMPVHTVTVPAYLIGKYEVIQSDWITVMGNNPAFFPEDLYRPIESVNWYTVLVYCNKRSISEGFTPVYSLNNSTDTDTWGAIPTTFNTVWNTVVCNFSANGYRLPTEAEWEYAARGATANPDYIYSGTNTVTDAAWIQSNSGGATHPVSQLVANGIGLHDMSGNVSEWCWDWYESSYYTTSPANNPSGPATGSYRVYRGGSWDNFVSSSCRIACRDAVVPYSSVNYIGLRVVRSNN